MTQEKQNVTSKEVIVGIAEYPVYEALAEVQAAMTEEQILKLLNAQVRTNELNRVRSAFGAEPSLERLREDARDLITPEEWRECQGDRARRAVLLDQKVEIVRSMWRERQAKLAAEAQEAASAS